MKEVIEAMKDKYPQKYAEIKDLFVMNTATITSETKQVQLFIKTLELLTNLFDSEENKASMYLKHCYVLDCLYKDFCDHLSVISIPVSIIFKVKINLESRIST